MRSSATQEELVPAAKAWIKAEARRPSQPWDVKGYKLPGGTPSNPKLAQNLPAFPANLRKQLKGANYPAPHHIMAAAVEGAQVDFDTRDRDRGPLLRRPADRPGREEHDPGVLLRPAAGQRGPRPRPRASSPSRPTKVVVLGAGMMGAAISYVCAKAGIEVVLKDVSLEAAEKGKAYSQGCSRRPSRAGARRRRRRDELLARITPTDDPADAAGADLVIEAVFEDPAVKAQVFAEIEPHLAPGALLGSNTSTLPITELAEGVTRPDEFIGLHFFSPVDKMPLLEIIKGEKTNEETLYRALDVAKQIKKTPIVVNDSRGFFTSRVIGTFINEGVAMLARGRPRGLDRAGLHAGRLPGAGAAALRRAQPQPDAQDPQAAKAAVEAEGGTWEAAPRRRRRRPDARRPAAAARLARSRLLRLRGRQARRACGRACARSFPPIERPAAISLKDLEERMLFIESIESVKCLDEGVIESVADANIGSIFGIGFPGWTGGVLQYINGYEGGLAGFVARARELAEATASASSRRPRWSRRPSAARSTATSRRRSQPPSDRASTGAPLRERRCPRRCLLVRRRHEGGRACREDRRSGDRVILHQTGQLLGRFVLGKRGVEDQPLFKALSGVEDGVGEGHHSRQRVAESLRSAAL